MSTYLIANIRVNDSEVYKDYVENVPALIEKHGGEYRVRGGETQVLEGQSSCSSFRIAMRPWRSTMILITRHSGSCDKP
jgi:uncharacterized protein (DUF1330 family)